MSQLLWVVLAAVAVVAGMMAIQVITVLVRLMQFRVNPLRVTALPEPPALPAHQRAAVEELVALGFTAARWSEVESGSRRLAAVLLAHGTEPAFAELTFGIAGAFSGFALSFHTFLADGTRLITRNRSEWLFPGTRPGIRAADAFADDVGAHWRAHLQRLTGEDPRAMELDDAQRAVASAHESHFEWLCESGAVARHGDSWHYSLGAAWRMARAWFAARRALARPYRSAASMGENEGPFFADFYLEVEHTREQSAARRDVKLWVLSLSAVLSFAGWGLVAGWTQALALIAIILFHESGHAVAMRVFGYRNMHMFFIPFIGAVVSGAPREMAAWRQAVILLAGPLPGLLAAIAALITLGNLPYPVAGFDWEGVAVMAVWINLFNLLPIMPLDGGQLMELALFRRWPGARLVFVLLSVTAFFGLAFWIKGPFMWGLAFLMLWVAHGQWRVARLQRHWQDGLGLEQQLARLFAFTRTGLKLESFNLRYVLVKSVVGLQGVHRARAWESAAVLLLMVVLWSSVVLLAREQPEGFPESAEQEKRSLAQVAYDHAYWDYLDAEPDDREALLLVEAKAAALDVRDPRLIDLEVERAAHMDGEAYRARLETLAQAGRDGRSWSVDSMVQRLLFDAIEAGAEEAPLARAARLRQEVARMTRLAPRAFAGTVEARLRIAEAQDLAGEGAAAEAALAELERAPLETYWRSRVLEARAWFEISHGKAADAVTLLEGARWAGDISEARHPVASTYAWALLFAGRNREGLAQMERVSHPLAAQRPTLWQRLRGVRSHSLPTLETVDLAYALRQTGHAREARELMAREEWHCWGIDAPTRPDPRVGPWQEAREELKRETLRALCPPSKCGS